MTAHRMPDEKFAELEFPGDPIEAANRYEDVYEEAKRAREREFEHLKQFTRYGMHVPTIKTVVEKLRSRAAVLRDDDQLVDGLFYAGLFEDEAKRFDEMLSDTPSDDEIRYVLNMPPNRFYGKTLEEIKAMEDRDFKVERP